MRSSDVEAEITLLPTSDGGRKTPAMSGYRPAHRVLDEYLTTGMHHYAECEQVVPGETVRGTITFVTPEAYPHCLWVGREIDFQEGSRVVGRARIVKILNPLLEKHA
jgi:translation elongation factor EF-Tu-like GTPase